MQAAERDNLVRTAIQVEPGQLSRVEQLSRERGVSRSKIIRDALDKGLPLVEGEQDVIRALGSGQRRAAVV